MSLPIRGEFQVTQSGEQQFVVRRTDEEGNVSSVVLPILAKGGFSAWWRGEAVGLKVKGWDKTQRRDVTKKVYIPTEGLNTLFGTQCPVSHGIGRQLASMLRSFSCQPIAMVSLEKMMSLLAPQETQAINNPKPTYDLTSPLDTLKKDFESLGLTIPKSWRVLYKKKFSPNEELLQSIWKEILLANREREIIRPTQGPDLERRQRLILTFQRLQNKVNSYIEENKDSVDQLVLGEHFDPIFIPGASDKQVRALIHQKLAALREQEKDLRKLKKTNAKKIAREEKQSHQKSHLPVESNIVLFDEKGTQASDEEVCLEKFDITISREKMLKKENSQVGEIYLEGIQPGPLDTLYGEKHSLENNLKLNFKEREYLKKCLLLLSFSQQKRTELRKAKLLERAIEVVLRQPILKSDPQAKSSNVLDPPKEDQPSLGKARSFRPSLEQDSDEEQQGPQ